MRKLALALLLSAYAPVLLAATVPQRISLGALCLAGQLFDGRTTNIGIARGAMETFPWMRPLVRHPHVYLSFKAAIAAWNIYESERSYRRHEKYWWAGDVGCASIGGFAGAWNYRQLTVKSSPDNRNVGVTP